MSRALAGLSPSEFMLRALAKNLVAAARRLGYVLTIETEPLSPLRMGNHRTVVTVRRSHTNYRSQK